MKESVYIDWLIQKLVSKKINKKGFYVKGYTFSVEDINMVVQEMKKFQKLEIRKVLRKAIEKDFEYATKYYKDRAYLIYKVILESWIYDYDNMVESDKSNSAHTTHSVRQGLQTCFFSQGTIFILYNNLYRNNYINDDDQQQMEKLALDILHLGERDANNRSFFYAIGHALAAKHFPYLQEAKEWQAYAEAVWNDWYLPGDCYEPGYVAHNIAWVIKLGLILGKEKELKSKKIYKTFLRYRDQISPSGLVIQPGDGGNQSAYVEALMEMAKLTQDGTFLWAAKKAYLAGNYGGYRGILGKRITEKKEQEILAEKFSHFKKIDITPVVPSAVNKIQYMYPATYKIPDRLILNSSRESCNPYTAFYINDRMETLHHAHEDNRGELYHYEVDGVMYLNRSSWHKWAGQTNTFVVDDVMSEFPFCYSQGLLKEHWYRASSNMRLLRDFVPSKRYKQLLKKPEYFSHVNADNEIKEETDMPLPHYFEDIENPYGIFLSNPEGMAGKNEEIMLNNITISINTFLEDSDKSFENSIDWYRDERSNIAIATDLVDIIIDNIFIAGSKGKEKLFNFHNIPDKMKIIYYEAGKKDEKDEKRILLEDEVKEIISLTTDTRSGNTALRITCLPGRMDLLFEGFNKNINLTDDYSRIGFYYKYLNDVSQFKRTPIKIFVNGLTCRSMYVDHQQGGILKEAKTEDDGKNCYGEMYYQGVYTYDSDWRRSVLQTEAGYLIVVDEFMPGEDASGMVGGPVWQLKSVPEQGINWFDSIVEERLNESLLVYFHPQSGHNYGVQCQPKILIDKEYAVYDKTIFEPGRKETFVSVMVPHNADIMPEAVCGKENKNGVLVASGEREQGINTLIDEKGIVTVKIQRTADWKIDPVEIRIKPGDFWKVY